MDIHKMTIRPLKVYLDQNKWIDLARAYHDRPDGVRYKSTLQKICQAVDEGKAIFPLSSTHVIETRKATNISRRHRLSQVMAAISQGWSIAPRYLITPYELQLRIAETFGYPPLEPLAIFGRGIPFAFGSRLILQDHEGAKIDMPPALAKQAADLISESNVIELFLVGDDEASNIHAVEAYKQSQTAFIKREEEFRSKAKLYDAAIHKRGYAANLTLAIQPELIRILSLYKRTMQDFLGLGQDRLMAFFENVPTIDVEIGLVVGRNEIWDKKIHHNDPADIAFLSVVVPYCDILVTEGFWRHLVQTAKLDQKYGTVVLNDLTELEAYL